MLTQELMNLAFQRRTDLALSALRPLASTEWSIAGTDLADALGTTRAFLPQIMSPLIKAGWVESRRGPRRGYRLTGPGRTATILDVIERTEGPPDGGRCVLRGEPCPGAEACQMHSVWSQAAGGPRRGSWQHSRHRSPT